MFNISVDSALFSLLWCGWAMSTLLLLFSYFRYKIFTFFDAAIVLSWFFIFFRPLNVYSCNINIDLYHWDELLYARGAIISTLMLLIFQIGSLLVPRRFFRIESKFDLLRFKVWVERVSFVVFLCCCVVVSVMFFKFGYKVFPSNRGGGALSVSMPGLEVFYHAIRALSLVLIVFSVVSLLVFKNVTSLLYCIFSIGVLLVFAKRNAIIYPILYSFFLYSFFYVYFLKRGLVNVFFKLLPLVVFLFFIAFFGKSFKSQDGFNFSPPEDGYACYAVRLGMQEFDLFWPAVIEVSNNEINILDLPLAVWGALAYDHLGRLNSPYLSITDKTMLKYNHDNYVYNKFGISPSIAQFYYYYFWWWGLFVVFVLGFVVRGVDFLLVRSFYLCGFGLFLTVLVSSKILLSPFDFTVKYSVFESVVFVLLYVVVLFYFSIVKAFVKSKG